MFMLCISVLAVIPEHFKHTSVTDMLRCTPSSPLPLSKSQDTERAGTRGMLWVV